MLQRPRLKAHFAAETMDGVGTFLVGEGEHFLLRGEGVAAVLPFLDGCHPVPAIVSAVADRVGPAAAFGALQQLEAGGHLHDGRPELSDAQLAYWDLSDIDPAVAVVALDSADLPVITRLSTDSADIVAALDVAGIRTHAAELDDALAEDSNGPVLVLADDYLDPEFRRLNDALLGAGRSWVMGKPSGRLLWVGPHFVPGRTGCWECLGQRVAGNRQVERYLAARRNGPSPAQPSSATTPAARQLFAGVLATELQRLLVTGCSEVLDGRLRTVDVRLLTTNDHVLVRQPQCPACGDPELIGARSPKVTLEPRRAVHTTDGGHRIEPPRDTYERMKRHVSPILGAVSSLHLYDDVDNGITYSFSAGHNFAMSNDNIDLLKRNLRGQSGGKGRTEMQAKVSALCEAVERYSGVWRGDETVTRSAYADLDPSFAIHPDDLLLFSDTQFGHRRTWNADPAHRLHLVPDRFDEDRAIDWSSTWSLTNDTERIIPAAVAWYGHPDLTQHFYCVSDSNGSASGNCLEEAVLQGFCEVAERDAVAVWWYNRVARRAFDLDSLEDPYTKTLADFYRTMQRELWVLDLTNDLGIPTFAAVSRREHAVQDVMVGFGAHPDARVAVMRSLTELNQFLPYVDQRDESGATIYRVEDPETLSWCREVTVESDPWLLPTDEPAATPADFAPPTGDDLAAHVAHCVDHARAVGVELLVLDQSRPDLDLNVVKVIAPGLRHFWRRLGPGRLYDVPTRLGWLDAPTAEADMNPRNLFF